MCLNFWFKCPDVCGIVEKVGEGCDLKVGDLVFGLTEEGGNAGGLGEECIINGWEAHKAQGRKSYPYP